MQRASCTQNTSKQPYLCRQLYMSVREEGEHVERPGRVDGGDGRDWLSVVVGGRVHDFRPDFGDKSRVPGTI
jgi:hypothetical protein